MKSYLSKQNRDSAPGQQEEIGNCASNLFSLVPRLFPVFQYCTWRAESLGDKVTYMWRNIISPREEDFHHQKGTKVNINLIFHEYPVTQHTTKPLYPDQLKPSPSDIINLADTKIINLWFFDQADAIINLWDSWDQDVLPWIVNIHQCTENWSGKHAGRYS